MQSFMRQKGGKHGCDRCGGQGCYHCERQGFILSCPACMSQYSQAGDGDSFKCGVCGTVYSKGGDIESPDEIRTRRELEALAQKTRP